MLQDFYLGGNFKNDINKIFAKKMQNKSILLITGSNSFIQSGFSVILEQCILDLNSIVIQRIYCTTNPTEEVMCFAMVGSKNFDCILAVGGGSVIDTAKKIKIDYSPEVDFYCIYTRYGSASPVTPFYVFDNYEFKIGAHDISSIPQIVYASLELMSTMPYEEKIVGISDIFAHASESYLSTSGGQKDKILAHNIVTSISTAILEQSINELVGLDVLAGLVESKCLVLLPHALGHYLTYTTGLAHGIASIIFLPAYLNLLNQYIEFDQEFSNNVLSTVEFLLSNYQNIDIVTARNSVIENYDNVFELIEKYMPFTIQNSPYPITKDNLREMLACI